MAKAVTPFACAPPEPIRDTSLDSHRRILAEIPRHLASGSRIFLEHESDQGPISRRIGEEQHNVEDVRTLKESRGSDRVLAAGRR